MPQPMTGAELKTIRESLLLSAQALADLLKHAGLLSAGNVRTVQRWEDGARGIPADIIEEILRLDSSVESTAQSILAKIRAGGPTTLVRFESDEDLKRCLDSTTPHEHRLHAAALQRVRRDSSILGRPLRIVTMEFEDYAAWRFQHQFESDDEALTRWALLQLKDEPGFGVDQNLIQFHIRPIRDLATKFHIGSATISDIRMQARQATRHIADQHPANQHPAISTFMRKLAQLVDQVGDSQPKVREALGRATEEVMVCWKELQKNGAIS